jgi:hypothetical protein
MFFDIYEPDFLAFFNNVARSLEASDFSPSMPESWANDIRFIIHCSCEHTVSTAASMERK